MDRRNIMHYYVGKTQKGRNNSKSASGGDNLFSAFIILLFFLPGCIIAILCSNHTTCIQTDCIIVTGVIIAAICFLWSLLKD